jgi:excisionase family DNA binding protein
MPRVQGHVSLDLPDIDTVMVQHLERIEHLLEEHLKRAIPAEGLLTLQQAMAWLKLGEGTVGELFRTGKIRAFRVGTDWRVSVKELERWAAEQQAKAQGKVKSKADRKGDGVLEAAGA